MFAGMKNILCLLTVFLMGAVSYGMTTVTAQNKEVKVLVIGMGKDVQEIAVAFHTLGASHFTLAETIGQAAQELDALQIKIENPYLGFDYDYIPIASEKPKHFYTAVNKPVNSKAIGNKAKHFRKSRDAI